MKMTSLRCDYCSLTFGSETEKLEHEVSIDHHVKIDTERLDEKDPHYCRLCQRKYYSIRAYSDHTHGGLHIRRLQEIRKEKTTPESSRRDIVEHRPATSTSTRDPQVHSGGGNISPLNLMGGSPPPLIFPLVNHPISVLPPTAASKQQSDMQMLNSSMDILDSIGQSLAAIQNRPPNNQHSPSATSGSKQSHSNTAHRSNDAQPKDGHPREGHNKDGRHKGDQSSGKDGRLTDNSSKDSSAKGTHSKSGSGHKHRHKSKDRSKGVIKGDVTFEPPSKSNTKHVSFDMNIKRKSYTPPNEDSRSSSSPTETEPGSSESMPVNLQTGSEMPRPLMSPISTSDNVSRPLLSLPVSSNSNWRRPLLSPPIPATSHTRSFPPVPTDSNVPRPLLSPPIPGDSKSNKQHSLPCPPPILPTDTTTTAVIPQYTTGNKGGTEKTAGRSSKERYPPGSDKIRVEDVTSFNVSSGVVTHASSSNRVTHASSSLQATPVSRGTVTTPSISVHQGKAYPLSLIKDLREKIERSNEQHNKAADSTSTRGTGIKPTGTISTGTKSTVTKPTTTGSVTKPTGTTMPATKSSDLSTGTKPMGTISTQMKPTSAAPATKSTGSKLAGLLSTSTTAIGTKPAGTTSVAATKPTSSTSTGIKVTGTTPSMKPIDLASTGRPSTGTKPTSATSTGTKSTGTTVASSHSAGMKPINSSSTVTMPSDTRSVYATNLTKETMAQLLSNDHLKSAVKFLSSLNPKIMKRQTELPGTTNVIEMESERAPSSSRGPSSNPISSSSVMATSSDTKDYSKNDDHKSSTDVETSVKDKSLDSSDKSPNSDTRDNSIPTAPKDPKDDVHNDNDMDSCSPPLSPTIPIITTTRIKPVDSAHLSRPSTSVVDAPSKVLTLNPDDMDVGGDDETNTEQYTCARVIAYSKRKLNEEERLESEAKRVKTSTDDVAKSAIKEGNATSTGLDDKKTIQKPSLVLKKEPLTPDIKKGDGGSRGPQTTPDPTNIDRLLQTTESFIKVKGEEEDVSSSSIPLPLLQPTVSKTCCFKLKDGSQCSSVVEDGERLCAKHKTTREMLKARLGLSPSKASQNSSPVHSSVNPGRRKSKDPKKRIDTSISSSSGSSDVDTKSQVSSTTSTPSGNTTSTNLATPTTSISATATSSMPLKQTTSSTATPFTATPSTTTPSLISSNATSSSKAIVSDWEATDKPSLLATPSPLLATPSQHAYISLLSNESTDEEANNMDIDTNAGIKSVEPVPIPAEPVPEPVKPVSNIPVTVSDTQTPIPVGSVPDTPALDVPEHSYLISNPVETMSIVSAKVSLKTVPLADIPLVNQEPRPPLADISLVNQESRPLMTKSVSDSISSVTQIPPTSSSLLSAQVSTDKPITTQVSSASTVRASAKVPADQVPPSVVSNRETTPSASNQVPPTVSSSNNASSLDQPVCSVQAVPVSSPSIQTSPTQTPPTLSIQTPPILSTQTPPTSTQASPTSITQTPPIVLTSTPSNNDTIDLSVVETMEVGVAPTPSTIIESPSVAITSINPSTLSEQLMELNKKEERVQTALVESNMALSQTMEEIQSLQEKLQQLNSTKAQLIKKCDRLTREYQEVLGLKQSLLLSKCVPMFISSVVKKTSEETQSRAIQFKTKDSPEPGSGSNTPQPQTNVSPSVTMETSNDSGTHTGSSDSVVSKTGENSLLIATRKREMEEPEEAASVKRFKDDGDEVEDGTIVDQSGYFAESPIMDVPNNESPIMDIPKNESPIMDIPNNETPIMDIPSNESPIMDIPKNESPIMDVPNNETPIMDIPKNESPIIDVPKNETPIIDVPKNETPIIDVPKNETPIMDIPKNENQFVRKGDDASNQIILTDDDDSVEKESHEMETDKQQQIEQQPPDPNNTNETESDSLLEPFFEINDQHLATKHEDQGTIVCNPPPPTKGVTPLKTISSGSVLTSTPCQSSSQSLQIHVEDISDTTLPDEVTPIPSFKPFSQPVLCMKIFNNTLYACSSDCSIRAYDVKTGAVLKDFRLHKKSITCLDVFEDNKTKYLLTGSSDRMVHMTNIETWKTIAKFKCTTKVMCLMVYKSFVYVAQYSGVVAIIDLKTRQLIGKHKCHDEVKAISSILVHEPYLFTSAFDKTLICWDIKELMSLDTAKGQFKRLHTINSFSSAVLSMKVHDGMLLCGSADKTLQIFKLKTWERVHKIVHHNSAVTSLNIHGDVLLTGSFDKLIRFFDLKTLKLLQVYGGHKDMIFSLETHNGVIYTGHKDGTITGTELRLNSEKYYYCMWKNCNLPFVVFEHLKDHVKGFHCSSKDGQLKTKELLCSWDGCDSGTQYPNVFDHIQEKHLLPQQEKSMATPIEL